MTIEQTFPLPQGVPHAGYVNNMREVVVYDAKWDCYVGRWDWIAAGDRFFYYTNLPTHGNKGAMIAIGRAEALRRLEAMGA